MVKQPGQLVICRLLVVNCHHGELPFNLGPGIPDLARATMDSPLRKEFEYYLAHQDEMVKKYKGKFIAIKDGDVLGAYDDALTAVTETKKVHELGTFLVQKVSEGDADYSQTFHSRVAFS